MGKVELPDVHVPSWSGTRHKATLPSCFSPHITNKCFFSMLVFNMTFDVLRILLFIDNLLFRVASKSSAEVQTSVPKDKKTVMYLQRKFIY